MRDRPAMIVVANSARALATSAKRAGYAPLAIDVFGDADTCETSLAAITLKGGLSNGLTTDAVTRAVDTLIRTYDPIGIVYGSGFEHQPESIAALARATRIFGNAAETLARVKDPVILARRCAALGVTHPQIASTSPDDPEGWLVKRHGGAGGAHIRAATPRDAGGLDCYFQRRVTGRNISALFVADGETAVIIGLSAQWAAPTPAAPFRYGGAVGPVEVAAAQAEEIARVVARLTQEFALIGLNSADFLVGEEAVWLIEINPRPGATLDLFEPAEDALLAHHVAACEGRLTTFPSRSAIKAAEVVYAPRDIMPHVEAPWPEWTADRPASGTRIMAGDPLCTVLAAGATVDLARTRAEERAREIIAFIEESIQ